ncbi:energy transducer TonB [Helicobacter mesocricetorum]|uniref:energy transducer TonB n=1 Tax=Helicobacter mesocricetorum TaxID=87012 RepID=UPI000CF15053|nr:energy transducer TonB [Helicobacter mesocricetorum]
MLRKVRNDIKSNEDSKARSIVAFFVSFSLHLVMIVLLFWDFSKEDLQNLEKYGNQEKERINIRDFKFVTPPKEILTPPQNQKFAQNEKPVTKPLKQDVPTEKKKAKPKEQEKPKEKKIKTAPSAPQKVEIKPQKEDLPQSLAQETMPENKPSSPSIYSLGKNTFNPPNKEMAELYGEDLHSLSVEERKFLEDNLKAIGKITQSYLKYPRVAGRTGQQGKNIVEFYLYPNGNISDLKFLTSSGYQLLDKNSQHTIEVAYKDYPYPSVKTKVRIQFHYRIH